MQRRQTAEAETAAKLEAARREASERAAAAARKVEADRIKAESERIQKEHDRLLASLRESLQGHRFRAAWKSGVDSGEVILVVGSMNAKVSFPATVQYRDATKKLTLSAALSKDEPLVQCEAVAGSGATKHRGDEPSARWLTRMRPT